MTLHISDIRPPSSEQIDFARIVDAALAEAGYTPSVETIERAFEVARASLSHRAGSGANRDVCVSALGAFHSR